MQWTPERVIVLFLCAFIALQNLNNLVRWVKKQDYRERAEIDRLQAHQAGFNKGCEVTHRAYDHARKAEQGHATDRTVRAQDAGSRGHQS